MNQTGPMNLEAESALLGAMMIDNRLIDRVLDRCEPGDMAEPLHGRIFEAIMRQQSLGRKANPITLRPLLDGDPALAAIGGPGYLATLTANSAALLSADDLADQVRELAKLRLMRAQVADALAAIDKGGADPNKLAAALESAAWASQDTRDSVVELTFADAIQLAIERQNRIDAGVADSGMICSTISDLNELTGGLQAGWLKVIAGRPGSGKTAVATSAAVGFAEEGNGVCLISLEMPAEDLGQRLAADTCHLAGNPVPLAAIREGRLNKQDRDSILLARDKLDKLPLEMVDASSMTLGRVGATIRRVKRKMAAKGQTLNIVIIDYLQLIHSDTKRDNRAVEVGEVSRGLKALAKQEGVCIIALAQLSREVEKREDKRPMLSDLRESGSIEQDADIVIFLYREEYYLRMAKPGDDKPDKVVAWQSALEKCEGQIDFIAAKLRAGQPGTRKGFFFAQNQAVRGGDYYRGQR